MDHSIQQFQRLVVDLRQLFEQQYLFHLSVHSDHLQQLWLLLVMPMGEYTVVDS